MVINHFRTHPVQEFVVALRSVALEECICIPAGTHTVNDVAPVEISVYHLIHGVQIILPVTVNTDGDVAAVFRFHEPGQYRVLVAPVPALGDSLEMAVFL